MKTRRRGKATVLTGQRPRKRSGIRRLMIRVLRPVAIGLGVIAVGALLIKPLSRGIFRLRAWVEGAHSTARQAELDVEFSDEVRAQLSEKQQGEIVRTLSEAQDLDHAHLESLARAILVMHRARSVALVRLAPDRISVRMEFHEPRYRVQADKTRLVSREGAIYGAPMTEKDMNLPFLNGIIHKGEEPASFHEDGRLVVTVETAELVKEAVKLIEALSEHNVTPSGVTFTPYRGFSVNLSDSELEVSFGRAPFGERPARLVAILDKLKAKGTLASRIELDFDGKAFIKEKPL